MDYVARGYSPALGRFISADTIVPGAGNPQAFNRYMYVLGNPLNLRDPSRHDPRGSQNNCNYAGQRCGGAGSQVDITTRHIIMAGTQWYYAGATADPDAGLDAYQTALDFVRLVPGAGEVADGANALISVAKGDPAGAGLSAVSMIPGAGDLIGKGGKVSRFAAKHADEALRSLKLVPRPAGIAGKADHVLAVKHLGEKLKDKWGDGFDILDRQTLNTASDGKIPLSRKPDKIVRDGLNGEIVEIGEAYRPKPMPNSSSRPRYSHELKESPDYAAYDLPVVWYQVPR